MQRVKTLRRKAEGALKKCTSLGITTVLAEVGGGNSRRMARDCLLLQKKPCRVRVSGQQTISGNFTPLALGYSPKGRSVKSHLLREILRNGLGQVRKGKKVVSTGKPALIGLRRRASAPHFNRSIS